MTFTEICNEVMDRMNLTSNQALTRVGRSVNERYKWVASSLGFSTIQQTITTATTTIGNRFLIFGPTPINVVKIVAIRNETLAPYTPLGESTYEELRDSVPGADPSNRYAVYQMGSSSVTVFLDSIPATAYVLTADVYTSQATLSGTDVPAFDPDFHDILFYWAMSVEYEKMAKMDDATKMETRSNNRLSDLRYYQAKSSMKRIWQGKRGEILPIQVA